MTKYYSASLGALSRPVAFRRGGTLHWVGSDHLGGTIRVLDSGFTAVDGMRYKPYGEDRDTGSSLNTDRKFTGQTEDETAGLYWYASRAYDPAIGRFVSPDSIVPDPLNPQSLNRYGYAYNNPLKYTDPTGHYNVGDDKDWLREFSKKNEGPPTASDKAFRQASMEAALQGQDFSVEYWAGLLERAASNAPTQPSNPVAPRPQSTPTRRPTTSPTLTPEPQPAPTPDPPYSSPQQGILNRNKTHLDTYYNTPITSTPDPTPYIELVGTTIVVNNAPGIFGDAIRAIGGQDENTMTFNQFLIISSTEPTEDVLAHEKIHVEQAWRYGDMYLPLYIGLAVKTGLEHGVDNIYEHHPMEKEARERTGQEEIYLPGR